MNMLIALCACRTKLDGMSDRQFYGVWLTACHMPSVLQQSRDHRNVTQHPASPVLLPDSAAPPPGTQTNRYHSKLTADACRYDSIRQHSSLLHPYVLHGYSLLEVTFNGVWVTAAFPRLVKHVDNSFLDQVTELYRQRIPPGVAQRFTAVSTWVALVNITCPVEAVS